MKQDDSIGFLINRTGRKISHFLMGYFHQYDITTEQWGVLNKLGEEDGISQKDLAKRVEKDQTNVTRILDQLERKGLIMRMPNKEDRRSFLTYLTDEGRSVIKKLAPIEEEALSIATSQIPAEKLTELRQILIQITENINQRE